jgi:formylglycine-generating enzyme required for sulfatase activity
MPNPESERLRQLVSDYYNGLVTAESYRQQRTQLLDNVGQPGVEPDTTATRPRREEKAPPPEKPVPTAAAPKSSSPRFGPPAISAVAVIAAIAVGYFGLTFLMDADRSSGKQDVEEVVTFGAGTDRGIRMLEEFLSRNDWTSNSLEDFALDWEALDEGQRDEATGGRQYRRLTMLLHRRIREQLALDIGGGSEEVVALTDFASAIGAPYQRAHLVESDDAPLDDIVEDAQAEGASMAEELVEPSDVEAAVESVVTETQQVDAMPVEKVESDSPAETTAQSKPDDPCRSELANTRRPYCQDVLSNGEKGPVLVVLPKGSFRMGNDHSAEESPSHDVEIAYHFAISRYEITAHEYQQFCNAMSLPCPEQQGQDDAPVVSVDWDDANSYVQWLSESTGFDYRLPTESEWEYAARAGTDTPYFFGDEITPSSAHWSDNESIDAPLGKSERGVNRNPFRLYHMSGNVREWVQDSWFDDYQGAPTDGSARIDNGHDRKVVRGGSYTDPAAKLRSAAREPLNNSHRDSVTGFRVVRETSDFSLRNRDP